MDIDRSLNPRLIYFKIIIKLCIFESQDIETLITEYKPSEFWDSLDPAKRRELIEKTSVHSRRKRTGSFRIDRNSEEAKKPTYKGYLFYSAEGIVMVLPEINIINALLLIRV